MPSPTADHGEGVQVEHDQLAQAMATRDREEDGHAQQHELRDLERPASRSSRLRAASSAARARRVSFSTGSTAPVGSPTVSGRAGRVASPVR